MKEIFKLTIQRIFIATCLVPIAHTSIMAQEGSEKPVGFIRFVNAVVEGEGQLEAEINGEKTNQKGYKLGQITRAFIVPVGTHEVTVSKKGTEMGKTRVKIEKNETTTMIPFAERVPATDDKPAFWAIRILRLKQLDPKTERAASFVSVASNPEFQVELGQRDGSWNSYTVKRLSVTSGPITYSEGYVPLRMKSGEEMDPIVISETGNYVVLFYNDLEGKIKSISFRDAKLLSAD